MPSFVSIPDLTGYLPSNVVDGDIIKRANTFSNDAKSFDLLSLIKSVTLDEIKKIEQQIKDLTEQLKAVAKQYEDQYKRITESRYSDENKKILLEKIRDNLDNEVATIQATIKNLTNQYNSIFKNDAYKLRENAEKSSEKYAQNISELLNLSKLSTVILGQNVKTIIDIVRRIPSETEQVINALFAIANLALTIINLKNYGIIDKLVQIEETINRLFEGNTTDYKRELQLLKMDINNVAYAIAVKEANLQRISEVLDVIDIIIIIIEILIVIAEIIIKLAPAAFLTVGVIGTMNNILNTLYKIVNFSKLVIGLIRRVIDSLKFDLGIQKARLEAIFSLFEISSNGDDDPSKIPFPNKNKLKSLNDVLSNLTPEEFGDLMFNSTKSYTLGYLKGFDYNGFKFYLKEENNPNFVVKGYKRRYAVAVNQNGKEVIQSDYSYTLEPEVLVEQLKLEINLKNLVA